MSIPFTKAHGARNDFLLSWTKDLDPALDLPRTAQNICERHTGVGADGWLLVEKTPGGDCDARIRLFNSDGSEPELSGNGTRCAAAFLIAAGLDKTDLRILTGAGPKQLRLIARDGSKFSFSMNMGRPAWSESQIRHRLPLSCGDVEVTIVYPGNPQCALFVDNFDLDWRSIGAEIERHPFFPNRTNVSFVRPVDEHTIDVRFWERGCGETMSSGTGSTGAAAAAILRGAAASPVRVLTPAGALDLVWENEITLSGPAEIVAAGEFYL